jgi:hypothetical protein
LLEPNYAEAYNLLGLTLSFAEKKQEAIDALNKAIVLSPRNPWFMGNLASAYLQAQDFDHAIPLLEELRTSTEPGIAAMAAQQLQQVEDYRSDVGGSASRPGKMESAVQTIQLSDEPESPAEKRVISVPNGPVLFMKGVLVSVDCSAAPAATLTISSGGKKWNMLAPQSKKLILIGAEEFSCSWKNRKVSVNYRNTESDQGSLVSLEFE